MHHQMGGMGCPVCGCGVGHGPGMGGFGMKGIGWGMKLMFKMMPWKIIMHADELGLSEEQVEALRTRHAEAKKQMIQIKSQIMINMIDVKNAVMREKIDLQTAEAKAREIGKLKGEKFVAMIQAMNDMRQILNPEQMVRIKDMMKSWIKKGGMAGFGAEEEEESESGEMSEED